MLVTFLTGFSYGFGFGVLVLIMLYIVRCVRRIPEDGE